MNLKSLLGSDSIALHLKGRTKAEIINELLALAQRSGKVKDPLAAKTAVFAREERMSTGMQDGLAIPHGKTNSVAEVVAVLGVSDHGVDFDSLDGEDSRIFIMTLSPESETGPHLRFLADISRFFENKDWRKSILAAKTTAEASEILGMAEKMKPK